MSIRITVHPSGDPLSLFLRTALESASRTFAHMGAMVPIALLHLGDNRVSTIDLYSELGDRVNEATTLIGFVGNRARAKGAVAAVVIHESDIDVYHAAAATSPLARVRGLIAGYEEPAGHRVFMASVGATGPGGDPRADHWQEFDRRENAAGSLRIFPAPSKRVDSGPPPA